MLYPRTGTTKGEVLDYYAQIAPVMLPHLGTGRSPGSAGRTASATELLREERAARHAVVGAHGDGADHRVASRRVGGDERRRSRFPVVDDLATLTWLVNLAALELHVHQWTVARRPAAQPRPAGHRPRPG